VSPALLWWIENCFRRKSADVDGTGTTISQLWLLVFSKLNLFHVLDELLERPLYVLPASMDEKLHLLRRN
tara:strand:+ start:174 stop:383 length:210 start_codon:yes stop_codon:yes gene_type:complete